ncbi:MAG: radical SAM protein [Deltaproteobacteria bacterium]|nr:radical SAM protein [Deltaproteobacteria bacterium]
MKHKAYALKNGEIIFIDPNLEIFELIKIISPGFEIVSQPPLRGFIPNIRKISGPLIGKDSLHLKIELARRSLNRCDLCGWNCGVNRYGESGKCGLKEKAYCSVPFVHICEEPPINPAASIKMFGCGMKCVYCQAHEHIEGWQASSEAMELNQKVWEMVEWRKAISLEFVGGNPTESIPAILEFLSHAPEDFDLAIVWNDNLYGSEKAYRLLDGLIDIYLPDFRYGNNECARKLSGVEKYWEISTAGLKRMMEQKTRIITRILILPGHFKCCHKRVLEWLSQFKDRIWISLLDQYIPEYRAVGQPELGRMATNEEVAEVEHLAKELGLRDDNKNPESCWI